MREGFVLSGQKQREVGELLYDAQSWLNVRRVIARLWDCQRGSNPRYVMTNLNGEALVLYQQLYRQRGEAENRIKGAQVGLFATRTSCQLFQCNQLRMLLMALGYVLIER
jgi:hypothetical protein